MYATFMIISDINQVNWYTDELGDSTFIDIVTWKHALNLQDVPFHGPRFTWSNTREGDVLIMERLGAPMFLKLGWMNSQTFVRNFPLTISDHALFYCKQNHQLRHSRDRTKWRLGVWICLGSCTLLMRCGNYRFRVHLCIHFQRSSLLHEN